MTEHSSKQKHLADKIGFIPRFEAEVLRTLASDNTAILLQGPRRTGKTSLVKRTFPNYRYITFKNESNRKFAQDDPHLFLSRLTDNTIIEDIDRAPDFASILENVVSSQLIPQQYIFSSSKVLPPFESIPRLTLMPFSLAELDEADAAPASAVSWIVQGGYPAVYDDPESFTAEGYIRSCLLPDVKHAREVGKLNTFDKFISVCAAHIGQPLNIETLTHETGINNRTANRWLDILQERFIVQLIPAFNGGRDKYQLKSPKLYFCDTRIAFDKLANYKAEKFVFNDYMQVFFENAIIMEIAKSFYQEDRTPQMYYWRDSMGHEIPLIVEMPGGIRLAIQPLATTKYGPAMFEPLERIAPDLGIPPANRIVVYMGNRTFETQLGRFTSFRDIS